MASHYVSHLISHFLPLNSFHMSFTGLCWTKNTWSKLLDQVFGTYCCLCLKHSSPDTSILALWLSFRSLLICQLMSEDLPSPSYIKCQPWASHSLLSSTYFYFLNITYVHLLYIYSLIFLPLLESKFLWGQGL